MTTEEIIAVQVELLQLQHENIKELYMAVAELQKEVKELKERRIITRV